MYKIKNHVTNMLFFRSVFGLHEEISVHRAAVTTPRKIGKNPNAMTLTK
jgi:hypothetical protein